MQSASGASNAVPGCRTLWLPDGKGLLMQALRQAYQVLIDPEKRRVYDTCGLGGLKVDAGLFGKQPVNGADLFLQAHLPFHTAAFGGVHQMECERQQSCHTCQVCCSRTVLLFIRLNVVWWATGYELCIFLADAHAKNTCSSGLPLSV
jgi:hypothetical protein